MEQLLNFNSLVNPVVKAVLIFMATSLILLEFAIPSRSCEDLFLPDAKTNKSVEQLDALDRSGSPSLVINLGRDIIDWQSVNANQLLQLFFPDSKTSKSKVPDAVKEWLIKLSSHNNQSPMPALVVGTRDLNIKLQVKHRSVDNRWLIEIRLFDLEIAMETFETHMKLTPREAEVVYWVTQGKANSEIGDIVGAASKTVTKHLENIFEKTGVPNRTALAVEATNLLAQHPPLKSKKHNLSAVAVADLNIAAAIQKVKVALGDKATIQQAELAYWLYQDRMYYEIQQILNITQTAFTFKRASMLKFLELQTDGEIIKLVVGVLGPREPLFLKGDVFSSSHEPVEKVDHGTVLPEPASPLVFGKRPYTAWTYAHPEIVPALERLQKELKLSHRQSEVLYLTAKGLTTLQITEELKMSISSANIALQLVIEKLQVKDKKAAGARAVEVLGLEDKSQSRSEHTTHILSDPKAVRTVKVLKEKWSLNTIDAEILYWIALSRTVEQTALLVDLGAGSVNQRLSKILKALGVTNRKSAADLIREQVPRGLESQFDFNFSEEILNNPEAKSAVVFLKDEYNIESATAEVLYWVCVGKLVPQIPKLMSVTANQIEVRLRQLDKAVGVVGTRALVAFVRPVLARRKLKPVLEVAYSDTLNQNVVQRAIALRLLEQYNLQPVQAEILFWSLIGKSRDEMSTIVGIADLQYQFSKLFEAFNVIDQATLTAQVRAALPDNDKVYISEAQYSPQAKKLRKSVSVMNPMVTKFNLEPLQAELFMWIIQGKSFIEIAQIYGSAPETIADRAKKLYAAMGVDNLAAAMTRSQEVIAREEFHKKHRTSLYGKRAQADHDMMAAVLKIRSVFKFEPMLAEVAIMVAAGWRNPAIAKSQEVDARKIVNAIWLMYRKLEIQDRDLLASLISNELDPELRARLFTKLQPE